jgi:SAM-dependent methyltransferase
LGRNLQNASVPVYIEHADISKHFGDLDLSVQTVGFARGMISGTGIAVDPRGISMLAMTGVKLNPLDNEDVMDKHDPHAAASLTWKPDIDLVALQPLVLPPEDRAAEATFIPEFTSLCIEECSDRIHRISTSVPHLEKFRGWLLKQSRSHGGQGDRNARILHLYDMAIRTSAAPVVVAMKKVLDNLGNIFERKIEALEVLLADNTLNKLYDYMNCFDSSALLGLLGHSKPDLRVLEIGAGTGGTTKTVLAGLTTEDAQLMFTKYTYTDISAGFFPAAKERFSQWTSNLDFAVLDISQDPEAQGLDLAYYDIVIATNVLHATPSLKDTLRNVRSLLRPGGRLLLQELNPTIKWINFIMGVLPGWWLGDADERHEEPYVAPGRWEVELKAAGFDGLQAVINDTTPPLNSDILMITKPLRVQSDRRPVTLLCDQQTLGLAESMERELRSRGYDATICNKQQRLIPGRDVISLLDIVTPFFANIQEDAFEYLKGLLSSLTGQTVYWVTQAAQFKCQNPRFAQTIGVSRVIRTEYAVDFVTCEVDRVDDFLEPFITILEKFQHHAGEEDYRPDYEYAIHEGEVLIPRYYPVSVPHELSIESQGNIVGSTHQQLGIEKFGRLNTMKWTSEATPTLNEHEVEVETMAVGMNFKV